MTDSREVVPTLVGVIETARVRSKIKEPTAVLEGVLVSFVVEDDHGAGREARATTFGGEFFDG